MTDLNVSRDDARTVDFIAEADTATQTLNQAKKDTDQEGGALLDDLSSPPSNVAVNVAAPPAVATSSYTLFTDIELRTYIPPPWRIKGVLPSYGVAAIFGPSGSGKSFLVLDMLQSLASGSEWFGKKVKPCAVTYVVLEGEVGLLHRLEAHRTWHGATSPNIRYVAQPFNLLNDADLDDLVKAIQAAGTGDVVVLDTLNRAIPGADENNGQDMGAVIASAKSIQASLGGLVLLVHHTGKNASNGMRGHSSLFAALDCAIEVKRDGDNREWLLAKNKDGEDGASHPFKLEVVHLGTDSDGDAINSCVVVPTQSLQAAQFATTKTPKLGGNQRIAHKALQDHFSRSIAADNGGASPGITAIPFDEAVKLVAPLIETAPKHQKERAKDAIQGLVTKGLLNQGVEGLTTPNPASQP